MVPGDGLYSQGTVEHYKQDMVSMYVVYNWLSHFVFGEFLGKTSTLRQVKVVGVKRKID